MIPKDAIPAHAPRVRSVSPVGARGTWSRAVVNKAPEVTIWFWILTVLSSAVGGTTADVLRGDLGLGLPATTAVMGIVLVVVLICHLSARHHVSTVHWLTVVLMSVVGTLLCDTLVSTTGLPLPGSTAVFALVLATAFAAWYRTERTLSVHSVLTRKRELYYWAVVLLSGAVGTAAEDLVAVRLGWGYLVATLAFGAGVGTTFVAFQRFRIHAVIAFWTAFVVARPFGSAIGDLLAAARKDGGLGGGAADTSAAFLVVGAGVVGGLVTQQRRTPRRSGVDQVAAPTVRP